MIHSYKELTVWQRAIELVVAVYKLTENFPKEEIYGLTSQMRRSAISIPSNIAEGRFRGTKNDFLHFLRIACGSGAKLETQIERVKKLKFAKPQKFEKADLLLNEIMRMLNTMIKNFNPNKLIS